MTETYVMRGGLEGRERLRILARVMWPATGRLLSNVGVRPASRCLGSGCGGGDFTVALARLVPDGSVMGVDFDEGKIAIARDEATTAGITNVEYRQGDIMSPPSTDAAFDVIYARF